MESEEGNITINGNDRYSVKKHSPIAYSSNFGWHTSLVEFLTFHNNIKENTLI